MLKACEMTTSGPSIRQLFAFILVCTSMPQPGKLWAQFEVYIIAIRLLYLYLYGTYEVIFQDAICADLLYRLQKTKKTATLDDVRDMALSELDAFLHQSGWIHRYIKPLFLTCLFSLYYKHTPLLFFT
jgi:hypothetical protein